VEDCLVVGAGDREDLDDELIGRFSLSITRLARILRQQEPSRSSPAAAAAMATIVRDGPLTLGELAAAEGVSPSTITKIVSKLEQSGVIERMIDPHDRRVHRVRLSERGIEQIEMYRTKRNRWLADQLWPLSPDERATVRAALEILERLSVAEVVAPVDGRRET
jgi:DNA-binding MarR family transcriptional regulator